LFTARRVRHWSAGKISLCFSLKMSHAHTPPHTLSLSHTHTHTYRGVVTCTLQVVCAAGVLGRPLSYIHTHSLSLYRTHTGAHTLSLSHTHTHKHARTYRWVCGVYMASRVRQWSAGKIALMLLCAAKGAFDLWCEDTYTSLIKSRAVC